MSDADPEKAALERRLHHAEYRLELTTAFLRAVIRHLPREQMPALWQGLIADLTPLLERAPPDLPKMEDEVIASILQQAIDRKRKGTGGD